MRAIVVDDSRAMRTLLKSILGDLGIEVVAEAGNGKEALSRLEEVGTPDLALVDWNMPEMNGYELICAVRAEERYTSLRMVMVTTEGEATHILKALEAGVDEYIIKPFSREAIREKLQLIGLLE